LRVRFDPDRAADVNRALARVGVFASRLEAGADLEALFLELTGDAPAAPVTDVPGSHVPSPDVPLPGPPTASAGGDR
jgi:hypothetical protein